MLGSARFRTTAIALAVLACGPLAARASAQQWPLYEHEAWVPVEVAGAECGDGSGFRVFFSASVDPGTERVVLWFPGGGSTSVGLDGELSSPIRNLATLRDRLTAPPSGPSEVPTTGTLPFLDHPANDAFIGPAHWVLLPYCTQDFHSGNRTSPQRYDFTAVGSLVNDVSRTINRSPGCSTTAESLEDEYPALTIQGTGACPGYRVTGLHVEIRHAGARNFELAYPLIAQQLADRGVDLAGADVMIAGSSAGGFSTWYNARLVGDRLSESPDSRLTLVPMSGSPSTRAWSAEVGNLHEDRTAGGQVDQIRHRLGWHHVTSPCEVSGGAFEVGRYEAIAARAAERSRQLRIKARNAADPARARRLRQRARRARERADRARERARQDKRCLDSLDLARHYFRRWPGIDLRIVPVVNKEDFLGVAGFAGEPTEPGYGDRLLQFCRTVHAYGQRMARIDGVDPWLSWLWAVRDGIPRRVHGYIRADHLVPQVSPGGGQGGLGAGAGMDGSLAYANAVAARNPETMVGPPRIDHTLALVEDSSNAATGLDAEFGGSWPSVGLDQNECNVSIPPRLLGVIRHPARGSATLELDAPAHGRLRLQETKRVKGTVRPARPGSSARMKLAVRDEFKERLSRRGSLSVRATISFVPVRGLPSAARSKRIRLVSR